MFVVTRWFELAPTHNARGGAIPQWEVWGRPVQPDEIGTAVTDAAERLLAEAVAERAGSQEGVFPSGPGTASDDGPAQGGRSGTF